MQEEIQKNNTYWENLWSSTLSGDPKHTREKSEDELPQSLSGQTFVMEV